MSTKAELIEELEKAASDLESLAQACNSENSATDYISGLLEKVEQR